MYADIHLPYFKQGDDLGFFLQQGLSPAEALAQHAEMLESAARLLRTLSAKVAKQDGVLLTADTHMIQIEGPEPFVRCLIEEGLAEKQFWDEDDVDEDEDADELVDDELLEDECAEA